MSSMSVDKKIVAGVGIIALVLAGMWLLWGGDARFRSPQEAANFGAAKAEVFEFDEPVESRAAILGEGYVRFTHPEYGFSVEYPDTISITAYREEAEGETIVFEDESVPRRASVGMRRGFQVFVTPFGDDEKITRERILEDVPFVTIDEPQEVLLGTAVSGGENIPALLFWSEDPRIGRTREVWFVSGGNLYEITAYAHLDEWLAKILSTWEFKQ